MSPPSAHDRHRAVVAALLDRHGRTYASEAGIRLSRNTPAPLFQLLCLSLLASARIGAELAMGAARALVDDGLTTPAAMADSTWEHRTSVLNHAGYARYDESTSRYLGATADALLDRYDGDLRRLRDRSGRSRDEEHRLLTEFTGIGDVGADLFLREVQAVWDEVAPFVDDRAADSAGALGLPHTGRGLRGLVPDDAAMAELAAALVRCGLEGDSESVRAAARDR